jgi:hypothetical protein
MFRKYLVWVVLGTFTLAAGLYFYLSDNAAVLIAKSKVEATLKDPSSVTYRNINAKKTVLGTYQVCGEFNAKNSFGAYAGFSRFMYDEASPKHGTKEIFSVEPKESAEAIKLFDIMWNMCGK